MNASAHARAWHIAQARFQKMANDLTAPPLSQTRMLEFAVFAGVVANSYSDIDGTGSQPPQSTERKP